LVQIPWVKRIQFCFNKGPGPLQRGYNKKKMLKMGQGHLKIFSRTTGPENLKAQVSFSYCPLSGVRLSVRL
jgi:hypothetical protein